MYQRFWFETVQVGDTLGALESPTDSMASVVLWLRFGLMQHFVQRPALRVLHHQQDEV